MLANLSYVLLLENKRAGFSFSVSTIEVYMGDSRALGTVISLLFLSHDCQKIAPAQKYLAWR
jgi:hypothetical protein